MNKHKGVDLKSFYDPKTYIEYSNDVDVFENINQWNPNKKGKILLEIGNMISDILSNRKT